MSGRTSPHRGCRPFVDFAARSGALVREDGIPGVLLGAGRFNRWSARWEIQALEDRSRGVGWVDRGEEPCAGATAWAFEHADGGAGVQTDSRRVHGGGRGIGLASKPPQRFTRQRPRTSKASSSACGTGRQPGWRRGSVPSRHVEGTNRVSSLRVMRLPRATVCKRRSCVPAADSVPSFHTRAALARKPATGSNLL